MNKKIRLIVSFIGAIGLTFFLFTTVQGNSEVKYIEVLKVKSDILLNDPITSENIIKVKTPVNAVPKNILQELPKNKLAAQNLYEGQCLLSQMLSDKKNYELKPEHRIYPIAVKLADVGLIKKGDKVDIFWSNIKKSQSQYSSNFSEKLKEGNSEILFSNIEVLNVTNDDATIINEKKAEEPPAILELRVTYKQALELNEALTTGKLKFARYLPGSEPVLIAEGEKGD